MCIDRLSGGRSLAPGIPSIDRLWFVMTRYSSASPCSVGSTSQCQTVESPGMSNCSWVLSSLICRLGLPVNLALIDEVTSISSVLTLFSLPTPDSLSMEAKICSRRRSKSSFVSAIAIRNRFPFPLRHGLVRNVINIARARVCSSGIGDVFIHLRDHLAVVYRATAPLVPGASIGIAQNWMPVGSFRWVRGRAGGGTQAVTSTAITPASSAVSRSRNIQEARRDPNRAPPADRFIFVAKMYLNPELCIV